MRNIALTYKPKAEIAVVQELKFRAYMVFSGQIDPMTGENVWIPPDKNKWETFRIVSPNQCYVMSRAEDMIPIEQRKMGVSYRVNDSVTSGVGLITPDATQFEFCHFGNGKLLQNIIINALLQCGIPESNIRILGNDILLNDKKISGSAMFSRGGYVFELATITIFYNDDLFQSILPEKYYLRLANDSSGITGILNEFPDINVENFYSYAADQRNEAPDWSDEFININNSMPVDPEMITEAKRLEKEFSDAKAVIINGVVQQFIDYEYTVRKARLIEGNLSEEETETLTNELAYMENYIDNRKEVIYGAPDLLNLKSILVSYSEFEKYYNYELAKNQAT